MDIGMLILVAACAFALGILLGWFRTPRRQREAVAEAVQERVVEAVSSRTRTVLAVLTVATGYHDDELAMELTHPGDIVQDAIILADRRATSVPVQKDARGTYQRPTYEPEPAHAGAF